MSELFKLGMNAKAYIGDAGGLLDALSEMSNVKDLTLSMEAGESDVTTRANSGWRATASTLKEATLEFQMQWKPGDDAFELVKDAYLASEQIRVAALTGARDASGSEGLVGDWSVVSFSRNEPLEEAITVDVSLKLAVFDSWVKVA